MLPKNLQSKINERLKENALRSLTVQLPLIDFSSNDYLGYAKNTELAQLTHELLINQNILQNGSTGSRLLSGNHKLYKLAEETLSSHYDAEAALIFNSGYDANIGFFSCIPQRGDIILYDEFIHASIRDGIKISLAKGYKFSHNDTVNLKALLERHAGSGEIYVVTESVFSMDGDSPDLVRITEICEQFRAHLIVDEAHAVGILGKDGKGLVYENDLQKRVFARLVTFGKALGCHGASILGGEDLKNYLVNYARSLIYTTALPPHGIASIIIAHEEVLRAKERNKLVKNITSFHTLINNRLTTNLIDSFSAIKSIVIEGNTKVKTIAHKIKEEGYDVKPILSPTVPRGSERLRFCLHSYNTQQEISDVLRLLAKFA